MVVDVERRSVDYFFFQAEDGIRDLVRSRGLGDVYKRQDGDRYHRQHKLRGVIGVVGDRHGLAVGDRAELPHLSLIHI